MGTENKISYAVVAPKVGKLTPEDTEKYHRVLKETYVPMSETYRRKLGVPSATSDLRADASGEKDKAAGDEVRPIAIAESDSEKVLN